MANGGRIQYTVGFNSDVSGLNRATQELQKIQESLKAVKTINIKFATMDKTPVEIQKITKELTEAKAAAKLVGSALQKSFNTKLNAVNVTSFNNELKKSGTNISEIGQKLSKAGVEGQNAFRNITAQIAKSKVEVKQTNKLLDEMKDTMLNSVKWGITSSIWNNMKGSIEKAWGFAKKLDSSLNDIRIVTNKSAQDMEKFAVQANKAAKNLGASTTGYTDASLIYYQQGLSDAEVQARTETTLKAANVTGQSAAKVSEQLTAVWNGYKVSAQEAELYVDKLSAVAATTAADLEELSTGMSKVASAANLMGVDIDQLNAQLATVVSVTRQAPESVGTAFKTIYARMGDIEAGLDTETSLGEYTKRMSEMGFNVLDTNGKLKDMGSVIEEIGNKWTDLSREQQVALSQTMAGTRQYNNLLALFDNWDEYTESLETSRNAAGSLQKQQDIYMESTEAHLQQLATEGERVYNSLFDSKQINPMIDGLTTLVSLIADAISGFGGMGPILLSLGSIFTRVFSKQIASSITTTIVNMRNAKKNTIELQEGIATLRKAGEGTTDEATKQISNMGQNIKDLALKGLITQEQVDQLQVYIDKLADLAKAQGEIEQQQKDYQENLNLASKKMEQSGIGNPSENRQTFSKIEEIAKKDNTDYSKIKEADELEAKLIDNNEEYKNLSETLKEQRGNLEDATKSAKEYAEALEEAANVDGASKSERKKKNGALKKQTADLLEEIKNGQFADVFSSRDDIQKAIKDYEESFDSKGRLTQASRKAAVELATTYQSALEEMTNNIDDIQDAAREAALGRSAQMSEELDSIINSEKKAVEEYQEEVNDIDFEKHISTITNLVGSIQSLASGVWGVINAFSVWGNEDLTFVEKLTQTISGLAIALPMAISGVTGFVSAWKDMKTQLPELIIKIKAKAAAIDEAAAAERRETEANLAGAASETADSAANAGNVISEEVDAKTTDKAAAAERRETEENLAGAASETADSAANAANASTKGLGKALGKVAGNVLTKAGPALAVVAVIAAVLGAVAIGQKMATAELDAAMKKAEEAKKKAEQLKESYNQVNSELQNMKQSFEEYNNAQKAIDEMIVGTEEWTQAIKEANAEVLELMSNYEGLSAYVTNEDGRLVISEDGQEKILEKQEEKANDAFTAKAMADIASQNAEANLKVAETLQELETVNGTTMGVTAGSITAIGAAFGVAAGGPIGAAIGAGIGLIVGAGVAAIEDATDLKTKDLERVVEEYQKDAELFTLSNEEFAKRTGITNEEHIRILKENSDKLSELSLSLDAAAQAEQLTAETMAKNYLDSQNYTQYDNSDFQKQIIKLVGQNAKTDSKFYKDALKVWEDKNDDEARNAYAQMVGATHREGDTYTINGVETDVDLTTAEAALAARDAMEMAGSEYNVNQIIEALDKLVGVAEENDISGDVLAAFAGGEKTDLSFATQKQIESLEKLDLSLIDDTTLNILKISSEQIETSINNYKKELEKIDKDLNLYTNKQTQDIFKEFVEGSDLTQTAQKSIATALKNAFQIGGNEGVEILSSVLNKIPDEYKEKFANALKNIDWTAPGALTQLKNVLLEIGIAISETHLDNLAEMLRTAALQTTELSDALITTLDVISQINKIVKDIEIGDILSTENYENLLKLAPEIEKMFIRTSEGYKFLGTGTEETLDEIIQKTSQTSEGLEAIAEETGKRLSVSGKLTQEDYKKFNEANDFSKSENYLNNLNYVVGRTVTNSSGEQVDLIEEIKGLQDVGTYGYGLKVRTPEFRDALVQALSAPGVSSSQDIQNIMDRFVDTSSNSYLKTILTQMKNQFSDESIVKNYEQNYLKQQHILPLLEMINSDAFKNASGWSDAGLSVYKEKIESGEYFLNEDMQKNVQKVLDDMGATLKTYDEDLKTHREAEESLITKNIKSLSDLDKAYRSGKITTEKYSRLRISYLYDEVEALGISKDEYTQYIQYLQDTRGITEEVAADQAYMALAQEKAVNNLVSNWETWKASLTEVNPNEHEYEEAISGIQEAFKGILDEDLSKDFIENNLSLFDDLANGVDGSFEAIQSAIAKYFGKAIIEEQKLTGDAKTDFSDFIDDLSAEAATMEFGDTLSDDLSSALSTMLQNTEYWSDDMYAILKALGLSFTELMNYQIALKAYADEDYEVVKDLAKDLNLSQYKDYSLGVDKVYYQSSDKDYATAILDYIKDHPEVVTKSIVKVSDPGNEKTTDKGKTSEPSKKDYLEEDRDRYHDINAEIKKLTNNLEDLKTAEEHLTGKDLINNLNQQLKILDKTVARQREKLKIQKQEKKELQAQLKSQGVQFDKDGTIANYNAILDSKMKDVNKAIATYNSFQTKEEQEAYEDELEAIEKNYEEFKEKLERYEELVYDDMQDLEQEIADNISEQISLKIQAFEVTIQIELDYTEALKSFNDFKKEMYLAESDIFGRSNIDLENLKLGYEDLETSNYTLRYLMQEYEKGKKGDESSIFVVDGEFDEATALEKIKEASKEVQDDLLNVNQLTNSILRSYLDAMDQAQEKIETQISHHEFINDLLNHGLKLTQLINGENDYTEKAKYYDDIVENDNKQIEKMTYAKNFWAQEMKSAKQALAEAANDQEKEIAQERYDKAVENWKNATNELNSYVETAVENLQAKYENAIDKILQDMTKSFTDGKSLDYISKEWELINDNADRYLDTVNSTYEVQSLEAKYMNAIDSTDSISAQKKLNKAMEEELAALREKDKLTQYDIDRANKKLDITMKQIALEEAQANKSTMRLRRDAQGNYSYQFVADEDEIAKAQQDLLAAQNDLYNFDKEAYEKNLDEAYQAYVQFQEDLKKAAMINDPEERAAYEALIREQYEQKITDLTAINETIRGNLQNSAFEALSGMYNTNEENFKLMNDDILADFSTLTIEDMPNLMGQLVEGWNTSLQNMITKFAGEEGFIPKCEAAYKDLKIAHGNYETELKNLKNSAGIFDDIYSDISDDITKTDDFTLSTSQLSATIGTNLTSAWANLKSQLDLVLQDYQNIKTAAEDAVDAANKLNEDYYKNNSIIGEDKNEGEKIPLPGEDDKDSKKKKKKKKTDPPSDPTTPENPKSDEEKEKGKMPSEEVMTGVAACIWYGTGGGDWDFFTDRETKLTEKFTKQGQQKIQALVNKEDRENDNVSNGGYSPLTSWAKKRGGANYIQWLADNYSYDKFDTGGYTGEWGAEGRMAMLHEKEIVLNKQDTANILNAVSIVRGIGDLINNLSANLLGSLSQRAIDSTLGMRDFEQNVHITAEFPNVSSSSEIEDALRNLTNVAAQRAFNTRI